MSVAGLKKQFHKASQLLSEKISGAEGTKLDEDFLEMERKIEVTNKSVFDLLSKTTEYLQPNPASRAKLNMLNTVSKIRGQVKTTGYPQTEGLLGDCMLRYGHELPEDSVFGGALVDMGEAMRQMADVKDSLDINVKQNFIDSLQNLQDKDLKEITHHLKKLEGRRLDFDYKKKRQGKIQEEEIQQAVEKFEESKELADRSMFNFLENDVEQVSQLSALIVAALVYHRQSFEILEELSGKLQKSRWADRRVPRRWSDQCLLHTPSWWADRHVPRRWSDQRLLHVASRGADRHVPRRWSDRRLLDAPSRWADRHVPRRWSDQRLLHVASWWADRRVARRWSSRTLLHVASRWADRHVARRGPAGLCSFSPVGGLIDVPLVGGPAKLCSTSPVGGPIDVPLVGGPAKLCSTSPVGGPINAPLVGGPAGLCSYSPVGGPIDAPLVGGPAELCSFSPVSGPIDASLVGGKINACSTSPVGGPIDTPLVGGPAGLCSFSPVGFVLAPFHPPCSVYIFFFGPSGIRSLRGEFCHDSVFCTSCFILNIFCTTFPGSCLFTLFYLCLLPL
uniref:BAR domain-containing protein n=1 Tax=Scophthalmus maximus TaxID=52904 RepID=A0A8D3E3L4_SCOMX